MTTIPDLEDISSLNINKMRISAAVKEIAKRRDDEIRRMLGLWASELEPVIMIGPPPESRLLGLGYNTADGRAIQVIASIDGGISFSPEDHLHAF